MQLLKGRTSRGAARFAAALLALFLGAGVAVAQPRAVTRGDVVAAALARGPRVAFAAADTGVATGLLRAARALPNPTFGAQYTEDHPQYHLSLDIPVDYPWLRSTRIKAAESSRSASQLRFRQERAAATLDADTLYTLAQAARAHVDLSRRNVVAADSLVRITAMRATAGEASDFDVQLATLAAGELHNAAANDSLEYLDALLALQTVMGLATDSVRVLVADSLTPPPALSAARQGGALLPVGAAQADLDAAELLARLERRNKWAPPSLSLGYDTRDPGGTGNKLLPAIGLSLPIPLLNGNQGAVAVAEAERDRARAALLLAAADANAAVTRTVRARDLAVARVQRGQGLVAAANRVAAMSLTAYREGAAPLASVLEAQRTAREALAAYVDDLARAWIAGATLSAVTLTVSRDSTP